MCCCTPEKSCGEHHHTRTGMCRPPNMFGPAPGIFSKRKMIQRLELYLNQLKEEIQDVEEYLAELKK